MIFQFGRAKHLYAKHAHPRLLIGPDDLKQLSRRIKSGDAKKIMQGLRRQARPLVERILDCGDLPRAIAGRKLAVSGTCGKSVFPIDSVAMMGLLDGDGRAMEAVRKFLLAMPEADQQPTGVYGRLSFSITWNVPLAYDLIAGHVPTDDLRPFVEWAVEKCVRQTMAEQRADYYKSAGSNIRLVSVCGVALLAALALESDPHVPSLKAELKELINFLDATLHAALGPQGYPVEDIGYGNSVMTGLAYVVEAARRAGLYDAYIACPRYARFGQAMLHFVQPWGESLSNTGDCTAMFPNRGFILARLASETRNPSLLWLMGTLGRPGQKLIAHDSTWFDDVRLSRQMSVPAEWFSLLVLDELKKPVHPLRVGAPTRFKDDTRSIISWRSGWKPEDTFVVFDGGQYSPSAQGHAHASGGHFGISALGEYFGIDTGRYCNDQEQHNVVLVDGKSGHFHHGEWRMSFRHSNLIDYRPDDFCDFAAVDSSDVHDCYWARRSLGFVKGRGTPAYVWTVEDINKAHDYREFWWTLNTHPNNRIETFADHAVIHGCRHGNLLDVHFILPAPESYPRPHHLTISQDIGRCNAVKDLKDIEKSAAGYMREKGYYPPEHPVLVRPRLTAKVAGYNGRFMSLMIPQRKDGKTAKVERLPSIDNSLAVKITFPDVEDTLIWACEHHLLEAGGVKARGQWIVMRRSQRGSRVLQQAVGDEERRL